MKVQISPTYGAPNGACCASPVATPSTGVVASMLAQLLRKHGLGLRSPLLHGEVSRFAINTLDTTGVALIFITYAELVGNPPHMRYLLRRIRQRFPLCPVFVGFWAPDDALLGDPAAQEMARSHRIRELAPRCREQVPGRGQKGAATGRRTRSGCWRPGRGSCLARRSGGAVTAHCRGPELPSSSLRSRC